MQQAKLFTAAIPPLGHLYLLVIYHEALRVSERTAHQQSLVRTYPRLSVLVISFFARILVLAPYSCLETPLPFL